MVRRQTGFNNQLEKRKKRRLGIIPSSYQKRLPSIPSNVSGQMETTITIPSQLQILEALSKKPSRKDKDDQDQPK